MLSIMAMLVGGFIGWAIAIGIIYAVWSRGERRKNAAFHATIHEIVERMKEEIP